MFLFHSSKIEGQTQLFVFSFWIRCLYLCTICIHILCYVILYYIISYYIILYYIILYIISYIYHIYIYIYIYIYIIYKYLIWREICSSNFPIASTLLCEIAILYFWETRTILKKLLWGAVDAVANTTDVYGNVRPQEQSRYGFYWQV